MHEGQVLFLPGFYAGAWASGQGSVSTGLKRSVFPKEAWEHLMAQRSRLDGAVQAQAWEPALTALKETNNLGLPLESA